MRYIATVVVGALLIPAAWSQQLQITPFLSCVDLDSTNLTMVAYFGYESFEKGTVQIVVGADNRFVPTPSDRNQPILFFPGYHDKAFRVSANFGGVLWLFNGFGVAAQTTSTLCTPPPQPPPTVQLPPGVVSTAYFQKLGAVGAKGNLSWQIDTPPPGLSLSLDGALTGTPVQAGTYKFKVTAFDGISNASTTYGMTVNGGLTVSDPLSTRPPGFVPQFRAVTQVGAGITATANCDSTEFVVTGGGTCVVPNQNTIQGRLASSQASGNGWTVTCSGGTASAMAVCSLK